MTKFKSDSSLKRVMNNGVFMALNFGIFMLMGIFFIPFLVNQFGKGAYGLVALAGFLTQYVGILSGSICDALSRFINIALNKQDMDDACRIFSTSIIVNATMVLFQIPFFALAIWKLNYIFDFSPEQALGFRILVGCNVAVYMIAVLSSSLGTPIAAANRVDINYALSVVHQLLRLGLLVSLILSYGPKLWIIGVVDLGLSLVSLGVTYVIYRRLANGLAFHWDLVSWKWVKPVMGMASWVLVSQLGLVLFQKTDVWIINRFVDRELAGVCAALLIWPNFAQQIAKNITTLVSPVIMIDYAQNRFARIRGIVLLFSGVLVAGSLLGCGIVMLFGERLLDLWMGSGSRQYHIFLVLMVIHFPLTLVREAIWPVFPAYNKMHYLGISNLISGALNIVLSLLAVYLGYGLAGVIIATAISLIIQRTVFLSIFVCRVLELPNRKLLKLYIPGCIVIAFFCYQWIAKNGALMPLNGAIALVLGFLLLFEILFREESGQVAVRAFLRIALKRG